MTTQTIKSQSTKSSIGLMGLIALGISCIFGSSWLVMGGIWLEKSGGPLNAIISFIFYTILIMIIAKSYLEISSILPASKGEVDYVKTAYGNKAAFLAGWSSLLVNALLCAWQSIAISKMLNYILGDYFSFKVLYRIGGYDITTFSLLIGILLICFVGALQIKGNSSLVKLSMAISVIVFGIVILTMLYSANHFSLSNLKPMNSKPLIEGTLSLMVILPFSIAGWETIVKGSNVNGCSDPKMLRKAMYSGILISSFLYLFILIYQAGIMPWTTNISEALPYVAGLDHVMGSRLFGLLIIIAAAFNIIGVYNGMMFGAVKSIVLLSDNGYLPRSLSRESEVTGSHVTAIIFLSALIIIVPFIGEAAFKPVINATAFIYVLLWGSTVVSNIKLKRKKQGNPKLVDFIKNPSMLCILFLGLSMILPFSPGSLSFHEMLMIVGLYGIGILIYIINMQFSSINKGRKRLIKFN